MLKNVKYKTLFFILLIASENFAFSATGEKLPVIFDRLVSQIQEPDKSIWPPKYKIVKSSKMKISAQPYNASYGYRILASDKLIKYYNNDTDGLAFAFAHELGHIVSGHLQNKKKNDEDFFELEYSKQEEFTADSAGMQLLLSAGYSYKKVIESIKGIMESSGSFSNIESLGLRHPSWEERLARIDGKQADYWKSMAAFRNGVMFLNIEQFGAASESFKAVINEFPKCYEAWANKGYSDLLKYCGRLSENDYKTLGIGYIAAGAFYREPRSIGWQMRGMDTELWLSAYSALKASLEINPNQPLANSNMALAYLVNPYNGPNHIKARQHFEKAIMLVENNPDFDKIPVSRIYLNAGVAFLSMGNLKLSSANFEKSNSSEKSLFEDIFAPSKESPELKFNKALLFMQYGDAKSLAKARSKFAEFIEQTRPNNLWRNIAYSYYSKICRIQNSKASPLKEFKSNTESNFNPAAEININEKSIFLSEDIEEALKILKARKADIYKLSDTYELNKYSFRKIGLELIASDKILAIILKSKKSQPLILSSQGIGEAEYRIEVGMKIKELNRIEGLMPSMQSGIKFEGEEFLFSKELGLGLSIKNHVVRKIIIARK